MKLSYKLKVAGWRMSKQSTLNLTRTVGKPEFAFLGIMRKAEFIEFKNKKDLQTKVNGHMGYKDRFWYMIELISLSQTFAPDTKKYIGKDHFITLKRIGK